MGTETEKHYAVVTDNQDPEMRGRLKVACQSLVGAGIELPMWVEPGAQVFSSKGGFGALFLPDVDSTVEIVVDTRDSDLDDGPMDRFLQNPKPRWLPAEFTDPTGVNPLPPELRENYPFRRGFKTPSGHYFVFDDRSGKESAVLVHKNGGTFFSLDVDGSVLAMTKAGNVLYLDEREASRGIKFIDAAGNSISLDATGIKIIDKFSNIIELKDGVLTILGAQLQVQAGLVNLAAGQVNIGDGATEFVGLGTVIQTYLGALFTWLAAHVHSGVTTGPGSSGPPGAPPPVVPTVASTSAMVAP